MYTYMSPCLYVCTLYSDTHIEIFDFGVDGRTFTSMISFPIKILGIIAPPFSHEFATAILPLLHNEEIMQSLRSTSDDEETIDMFIC